MLRNFYNHRLWIADQSTADARLELLCSTISAAHEIRGSTGLFHSFLSVSRQHLPQESQHAVMGIQNCEDQSELHNVLGTLTRRKANQKSILTTSSEIRKVGCPFRHALLKNNQPMTPGPWLALIFEANCI